MGFGTLVATVRSRRGGCATTGALACDIARQNASNVTSPKESPELQHTVGKVDCSPADVGFDESRVGALHRHFARLMDENKLQGASY
jgi:hypothetical protein